MGEAAKPSWAHAPTFFAPTSASTKYLDGSTGELATLDARRAGQAPGSVAQCFATVFQSCAARPCLGRRPAADKPFEWTSYASFDRDVRAVAAGLMEHLSVAGDSARVGICAANSFEWVLMDFGCMFAGLTSVALSETWDLARLAAVAKQARVNAIATDSVSASRVFEALKECSEPQLAITMARPPRHIRPSTRAVALEELLLATPLKTIATRDPNAVHTIFHTSGTTGLPKGVLYSDKLWEENMIHMPAELMVTAPYQPFGFITDRHLVNTTLWNGGRAGLVCYFEDHSTMEDILGDLQCIRPTMLKGVPKFYEQIQVAARMQQDLSLNILGGRVHSLACGGGALDPKVAEWYASLESQYEPLLNPNAPARPLRMQFRYGSTEAGNLADERHMRDTVEWKLLPLEGFDIKDGVGELVVKTTTMFGGYDNHPEKTRAAFTDDGFFKMGDLVRITWLDSQGNPIVVPADWDPTNSVKGVKVLVDVLGRAGSSIKLGNGKWIAVEALEDLYRGMEGIRHIMIYGDSLHDRVIAIVDFDQKTLPKEQILPSLKRFGQTRGKPYYEIPAAVVLSRNRFTRENGCLNGTYKLDRHFLQKEYGQELETAFIDLAGADAFKDLDGTMCFQSAGGTSIKANEIAQLYSKFGVRRSLVIQSLIPPEGVEPATLNEVQASLEKEKEKSAVKPEDIHLPPEFSNDLALQPSSSISSKCKTGVVFVTGGTGFIGPFVIGDLLRSGRQVICLVRAPKPEVGLDRVMSSLQNLGALKGDLEEIAAKHLRVVVGTCSQPYFGLHPAAFDELASEVCEIIHLAALVDLGGNFAKHKLPNVDGTVEVLRLGFRARARVVFASSTDVLPSGWSDEEPAPKDVPFPGNCLQEGYKTSKIVAERLVETAGERGLSIAIARLGFIGGHSASGVCNARDLMSRLLIGFAHTKAFPETTTQAFIRFLPVDIASRALVQLLDSDFQGALHVTSGSPNLLLKDLRKVLLEFGSPFDDLPVLSFQDWMERAELDGAYSVWPVINWARKKDAFPFYNSKSVQPTRILGIVDDAIRSAMKCDCEELESIVHKMVKHLFQLNTRQRLDSGGLA